MSGIPSTNPSTRQILANVGNRFVVFGPEVRLPEPLLFNPADYDTLPRVADESEVSEARVAETLRVSGMTRSTPDAISSEIADIEFVDPAGNRTLVEVKLRERDLNKRDLQWAFDYLDTTDTHGRALEVWFLNTERLGLTTMRREGYAPEIYNYVPLTVWEKTAEGVFDRQHVLEEADNWRHRVEALYDYVRHWADDRKDLRFEQTRTVVMAEEIMQRFAVPDRELAILDVLRGEKVVASFVPRGLWLIGAWGRIDIITEEKTYILVAIKEPAGFVWQVASPDNRRLTVPFDDSALAEVISGR